MPYSSADPAAFVGLGMQTALGTNQTSAPKFRFAKYLSGTEYSPQSDTVHMREGMDGLDFGFSYKQRLWAEGQLQCYMRPEITGQLLSLCLGGATIEFLATMPAIHTFHSGHASFPWSTMQVGHPATSLVHWVTDAKFKGFTIEAESGQPWMITAPFTALAYGASSTVLTPTVVQEAPFMFHDQPAYQVNGATDTTISRFQINGELGVEELQAQRVTLDEIVVQNRDANIEMVRRYEDPTQWKNIWTGGGVAPTTSVPTGSFRAVASYGSGAGATTYRWIDLQIPLIGWDGIALSQLDPDGQTITETWTGKILKGSTHAMIFKLANAHPSVYGP